MKWILAILLVLIGFVCGMAAFGETNSVPLPPPPSAPAEPYTVDDIGNTNSVPVYPFLLCYGVRDDGSYIFEPPPQWMLDGPPQAELIPITIISTTNLTASAWTNAEIVIAVRADANQEFFKLRIGE